MSCVDDSHGTKSERNKKIQTNKNVNKRNKQTKLSSWLFKQFSSVVTWQYFSQYVQDSVLNVSHLPEVNQRIQR